MNSTFSNNACRASFNAWRDAHEPMLLDIEVGASPKEVIHALSEGLLACFADLPLLNPYDVYQRLMNFWDETMQDDVYLIVSRTGGSRQPNLAMSLRTRTGRSQKPPDLIIKRKKVQDGPNSASPDCDTRYFAAEQDAP